MYRSGAARLRLARARQLPVGAVGSPLGSLARCSSTSPRYVNDMHAAWQRDPASVDATWDSYFRTAAQASPAAGDALEVPASSTGDVKAIREAFGLQSLVAARAPPRTRAPHTNALCRRLGPRLVPAIS